MLQKSEKNGKPRYEFREHKDEILTHIIKNILWLPIANGLTALIQFVITMIKNYPSAFLQHFSFVLSIMSIMIAVIALLLKGKTNQKLIVPSATDNDKQKTASMDEENCNVEKKGEKIPLLDFKIESIVAEFHIHSRDKMTSSLQYDMTSIAPDVSCFQKEIIWTGTNIIDTQIEEANGKYELKQVINNNGYHTYKVDFGNVLSINDRVRFCLKTNVNDDNHTMDPFYAFLIKHQTKELVLRIVVDRTFGTHIRNVRYAVYYDNSRQMCISKPVSISRKIIGNTYSYEYKVSNPTLLHYYTLEWDFVD